RVIAAAAFAVARVPDPAFAVTPLLRHLVSDEPPVVLAVSYTLARLASSGLRGSASPQARISQTDRTRIRRELARLAASPDPDIRMQVARALTGSLLPEDALILGQLFKDPDPRVRASAIVAMAFPGAEIDVFELAILDPSLHVKAATVEGLGRLRSREAIKMLLDLLTVEAPPEVHVRVLRTLRTVDPVFAAGPSSSLAHTEDPRVRAAAVRNLEFSPDPELTHLAEHLLEDVNAAVRAAAVPLLVGAPEPLVELLGENLDSDDPGILTAIAETAGERLALHPDEARIRADALAVLQRVRDGSKGEGFSETRLATIEAAVRAGADPAVRAILLAGLDDEDRRVRASAARAVAELYDEDHGDRVGPLSERTLDDYREIVEWARKPRAALIIVQREGFDPGRFTISLDTTHAPLSSWNFARLASSGFYDGSIVHRLVPNFVVQTGAPAPRDTGGPGYEIRSERNTARFGTGTLGMAQSEDETHGSQWFVTLSPQPHLDDRFTAFGSVVQNFLGTVLLLEPEDWIVTIQVYEGTGEEPLPAW
ncbi:MAG: peptidylprolyl isomerase, partial [Acidobacteriota bacterium]|nr:peptidylprolyl isomerase [Acidobacteriota bacterium]